MNLKDPAIKCLTASEYSGRYVFRVTLATSKGQRRHRLELALTGNRADALTSVQTVAKFADRHGLDSVLFARRLRVAAEIRLRAHRFRRAFTRIAPAKGAA